MNSGTEMKTCQTPDMQVEPTELFSESHEMPVTAVADAANEKSKSVSITKVTSKG